jgi:hypothetical protein
VDSIRRLRRALARRAKPPGGAELQARQPRGQEPHLAARTGRDGLAGWFIQYLAATANAETGQNWPARTTKMPRRRTMPAPRLLPHTVQLRARCQEDPAGFWVSRNSGQTVGGPWCLSCCQHLDPCSDHAIPFDG